MTDQSLTIRHTANLNVAVIVPRNANKDEKSRLTLFADYLNENGIPWYSIDLETYRDYLLYEYSGMLDKPLSPSSVKAHLSTIRGRYRAIARSASTRDWLYALTPKDASPADKKAVVDEVIERIRNAIDPELATVKVVTRQDIADDDTLRLTTEQANALLAAPGTRTLKGVRDTAIIALLLCTGLREAELCQLNVADLHKQLGGQPALHVRRGKGAKERLVPYGDLIFCRDIALIWCQAAGITAGAIFRGFYRGARSIRKTRLTTRAINYMLEEYPIDIDGELRTVKPHDLRRTYARRLYEAGTDLLAIRDNLGHADSKTTLRYIGEMNVERRQPPALYTFDIRGIGRDNPADYLDDDFDDFD